MSLWYLTRNPAEIVHAQGHLFLKHDPKKHWDCGGSQISKYILTNKASVLILEVGGSTQKVERLGKQIYDPLMPKVEGIYGFRTDSSNYLSPMLTGTYEANSCF